MATAPKPVEAEVKPVKIIVDSRESRSMIAQKLSRFPGVSVEVEELASGDYLIAEGVAVERKDANDFLLSVMSGHLFDQLARMKLEHKSNILLIEGDPYSSRSAIAPEAIDGALSWVALLSDVNLIFSPSLAVTPRILWRMAIHATHGLGYQIPLRAGKPKAATVLAEYIVQGLPTVGPSTAQKLLAHFKSPIAIFSATVADLKQVNGIGDKSAQSIYTALHTQV